MGNNLSSQKYFNFFTLHKCMTSTLSVRPAVHVVICSIENFTLFYCRIFSSSNNCSRKRIKFSKYLVFIFFEQKEIIMKMKGKVLFLKNILGRTELEKNLKRTRKELE